MVKTKLNKRLYSIGNEIISLVFPKQSSLPLLNFQAFFNSHTPAGPLFRLALAPF
jgi:hypothetical protein